MPYVTLNGHQIDIKGKVKERTISPWTAKISSGSVDFGSFQPCDIIEWADCRGGIGLEQSNAESDQIAWSESVETTKERYLTLGPLVTSGGDFTTPLLKAIDLGSYTYFFGNSVSKYWTGSALAEADTSPLATPTDAIVYKDNTNTYLAVCNGTSARYATTGFGASKDWASLTSSPVKYFSTFDDRLIGLNATGTVVYYSAKGDIDSCAGGAMSSFNIAGPWTTAQKMFNGTLAGTEEPALFMVTDKGLIWIDFWTRKAYPMEVRYNSQYALAGMYWNSEIYVGVDAGIIKVGSSLVSQYGPDQKDGIPADYCGYIYDLLGISHWVVCAVSGGTCSSILKRHESLGGWHQVYSSPYNIRCIYYSALTSPGKLWFGEGNSLKYVQLPDKTHDVTKTSGYTYAATGSIIFPRMTKLSIIPKTAIKIEALTGSLDADNTIAVYYRIDTATDWTLAGTFNTAGHPTAITLGTSAGISFNDIQVRVVLTRSTTTTVTPVLKSLVLKYVPNPPAVQSWSFNIAARGAKSKQIIDWLVAARDATTLVTFSPVGNTSLSQKYVKVEQMPSEQDFEGAAVEKDYTVVVNEVG